MTAQLSAYGRLGQEPKSITTQSGKPMAVGSLAVTVAARGDEDGTLWLGVVAFGSQAETLLTHAKGDMLAVVGRVQLNRWTDKDGHAREDLQVVADQITSTRTVRPGKRKRNDPPAAGNAAPGFDDDLKF